MKAGSDSSTFQLDSGSPDLEETDRLRLDTRARYRKTLADYAADLGKSPGTLKRWIRIGRKVPTAEGGPDYPPFDSPEQLAAWYERRMGWKVPEVLLRLVGEANSAAPESDKSEGGDLQNPPPGGNDAAKRLASARESLASIETGFAAALDRCEQAEALAYARWQTELNREGDDFDPSAEAARRKSHDEALTKLRQMQSGAGKILADSAEFGRWDELEAEVATRAANLKAGLSSLMIRIASKVRIPADLFGDISRQFDHELDSVFETMAAGDFAEPLILEAND